LENKFAHISLILGGGTRGHNGIRSIIDALGGNEKFWRIRLGIGRPDNPNTDITEYVLANFSKKELQIYSEIFPEIKALLLKPDPNKSTHFKYTKRIL